MKTYLQSIFLFCLIGSFQYIHSQSLKIIPVEVNNSAGIKIRSSRNINSSNIIAALPNNSRLVSVDLHCEPNNPSNAYEWFEVHIPGTNGNIRRGYMVKDNGFTEPACSGSYGRVINAPNGLNIRTDPSVSTSTHAKINGVNAKLGNGAYIAIAGQSSGWYRIYVPNNVTNSSGQAITYGWVSSAYISPAPGTSAGRLRVYIDPPGAITAGAEWNLDDDCWQSSGDRIDDLCYGIYELVPKQILGFTAPSSSYISINQSSTTTRTLTYTPIGGTGSVRVTISPSAARNAGAEWRLDSGPWRNSGYTETGVSTGGHTISFKSISGWNTPSSRSITVSNNNTSTSSGTYTQSPGNVTVTINPSGARNAGAQWRLNSGPWRNSGYTEVGVTPGNYTISFSTVPNWITPSNISISLNPNQSISRTGNYSAVPQIGSVSFSLYPQASLSNGVQWRLDGGAWQNSGSILNNILPGPHTISFKNSSNWGTPNSQTINVIAGQTYFGTASYQTTQLTEIPESQARDPRYMTAHGLDPVNLATGAFVVGYQDLKVAGRGMDLVWRRFYNSRNTEYQRHLGRGWSHSYDIHLSLSQTEWKVHYGEGHEHLFVPYPDDTSQPRYKEIYHSLIRNLNGTYTLRSPDDIQYIFDSIGRCTQIKNRNGNEITLSYSGQNLISITAPGGRTLNLSYDGNGRITSLTDPINRSLTFGYDSNSDLTHVTSPRGYITQFGYDTLGQIRTITPPRALALVNTYDSLRRVNSQIDALSTGTSINYNWGIMREATVTHPNGSITKTFHTNKYKLLQENDGLNYSTFYFYDTDGNVIRRLPSSGNDEYYTYNSEGYVTSHTSPLNNVTKFDLNQDNDPIQIINAKNDTISFLYDSNGNLLRKILPNGASSRYYYTSDGLIRSAVDALGDSVTLVRNTFGDVTSVISSLGTTSLSYDDVGRILSITDHLNHTTSFTYDEYDNILTETNHYNHVRRFTYDVNGNLTSYKDKKGNVSRFEYDQKDRLTKFKDPKGIETSYFYDNMDNLTFQLDFQGNRIDYTYDNKNQLLSRTDDLGTTRFSYDRDGNITQVNEPGGRTTTYTYDKESRLIAVEDPSSNISSFDYDELGLLKSSKDPLLHETKYDYDVIGQLTKVILPNGDSSEYSYDLRGNLTSLIDPKGYQQQFRYDKHSRLLEYIAPSGSSRQFTYDAVGNPLSITEANGVSVSNTYDALYRLTQSTYSSGENYQFAYDANGNTTQMTNYLGSTLFNHDERDQIRYTLDPFGNLTRYKYDGLGNQTQIIYPSGDTVFYSYNSSNLLETVSNTQVGEIIYAYDSLGLVDSIVYPNGTIGIYKYDYNSRVSEIKWTDKQSTPFYHTKLAYDATGNLLSKEYLAAPLVPKVVNPQLLNYTYDQDNILTSNGLTTYSNDPSGNRLSENTLGTQNTFSFSGPHLLTSYNTPGNTVTSSYDPVGNRLAKESNGVSTNFALDQTNYLSQVLEEQDSLGSAKKVFVFGDGLICQKDSSGNLHYFHFDAQGNTIAISDSSASVVASYTYSPFGVVLEAQGLSDQPYQFMGKYGIQKEAEGLYFIRARWYDARNGRFLSKDPYPANISNPLTINRFAYGLNNPLAYFDADGLKEQAFYGPYYTGGSSAQWMQGTPRWLSITQTALDFCGLVPAYGEICDLTNAGIYLIQGDHLNAGLSASSAIPFIGWAGTAAKGARRVSNSSNATQLLSLTGGNKPKLLGRGVTASWGRTFQYRIGGRMTAMDHILYRHSYNTNFTRVSKFSEGTTQKMIKEYVYQAAKYGKEIPGGFEYNVGKVIGTGKYGQEASKISVFIRNGWVKTAYPVN
ncbi:MAG: DUF6531 domain-containing protein [Bacteroidota bacterium]